MLRPGGVLLSNNVLVELPTTPLQRSATARRAIRLGPTIETT